MSRTRLRKWREPRSGENEKVTQERERTSSLRFLWRVSVSFSEFLWMTRKGHYNLSYSLTRIGIHVRYGKKWWQERWDNIGKKKGQKTTGVTVGWEMDSLRNNRGGSQSIFVSSRANPYSTHFCRGTTCVSSSTLNLTSSVYKGECPLLSCHSLSFSCPVVLYIVVFVVVYSRVL